MFIYNTNITFRELPAKKKNRKYFKPNKLIYSIIKIVLNMIRYYIIET